jgi:hypothetical protein
MDEPTPSPSIPELVIAGLGSGLLWVLGTGPVWATPGTRKPCVVCWLRIDNYDIQYDVLGPRGSLPVHVKCYRAWRGQSDKLRKDTRDARRLC